MENKQRAGAAALGAVTASSMLLLLAPGQAMAQEVCNPDTYPPQQCRVVGGAGFLAPPLVVDLTVGAPGSRVSVRVNNGFAPGASITIAIVRMTNGAAPVGLRIVNADASGGFDTSVVIPSNAAPGVYVLYAEGRSPDSTDTTVATTSFVVVPAGTTGSLRTSSTTAGSADSAGSTSSTTAGSGAAPAAASDAVAAVAAADVPQSWSAPASWDVSPATRAAVAEAVNLRLAAMRAKLPAQAAPATAAPQAAVSPTDLTPWYAAGGALALIAIGTAGWRRRAVAGDDTNSEVSA